MRVQWHRILVRRSYSLVAWQRNGCTVQASSRTLYVCAGSAHPWGLMPALFPLFLISSQFPDLSAPLSRPKFHLLSPREEVSEVLSV